ncbi:MAG: hypothetical protein KIT69_01830 [Propionibacteriaceae bacterium]|nr:hypothetical protein [Propionibacteriaceae bacterium]
MAEDDNKIFLNQFLLNNNQNYRIELLENPASEQPVWNSKLEAGTWLTNRNGKTWMFLINGTYAFMDDADNKLIQAHLISKVQPINQYNNENHQYDSDESDGDNDDNDSEEEEVYNNNPAVVYRAGKKVKKYAKNYQLNEPNNNQQSNNNQQQLLMNNLLDVSKQQFSSPDEIQQYLKQKLEEVNEIKKNMDNLNINKQKNNEQPDQKKEIKPTNNKPDEDDFINQFV